LFVYLLVKAAFINFYDMTDMYCGYVQIAEHRVYAAKVHEPDMPKL